ncbi:phosphoenolpyruvate synthase, partial [candidate division WWE3 bacterium]|nr:phosphoenolpyruvate synthase [candidate division WWE3 bacterium]
MSKNTDYIKDFKDTSKKDINMVGGKGANLGEMTQTGLPVPPGFTVTSSAFQTFLTEAGLQDFIKEKLTNLDREDSKLLQKRAEEIKKKIVASEMPKQIETEIGKAYKKLSKGDDAFVAVRSSATAEDLPGASFAGQQETYLDVRGIDDVIQSIKMAWASLFEPRAIFYREEKGFDHFQVSIAVPAQMMVQSEISGVMFTVDPLTNDLGKIAIEAIYGLGDALVSGQTTPDQYLVSKADWSIVSQHTVKQTTMLGYTASSKEEQVASVPVSKKYQNEQKLTEKQIIELAKIGKSVEDHYDFPQDIEWAYQGGKFYLVQTRPVTTVEMDESDGVHAVPTPPETLQQVELDLDVLLNGIAASPGVSYGPVKVIHSANEINKVIEGDILVTEMTTPDFVPAMRRAVAIVTDEGGRTSHAAIVSRELGIPAVVGTQEATKSLKNKEGITVDGFEGNIYQGDHNQVVTQYH